MKKCLSLQLLRLVLVWGFLLWGGILDAGEPPTSVERATLPGGLRVVVVHQPGAPDFSATFLHRAGMAREWQGLYGAAELLGEVITDGTTTTGSRNWRQEVRLLARMDQMDSRLMNLGQLSRHMPPASPDAQTLRTQQSSLRQLFHQVRESHREVIAANLWRESYRAVGGEAPRVKVGHDGLSYSVTLPRSALPWFLRREGERMGNLVTRTFYSARDRLAESARARQNDPALTTLSRLVALSLGGHPYGRYKAGAEDLAQVDRGELQFFLKTLASPANTILVVVGDLHVEDVRRLLTPALPRKTGVQAAELPQVGLPVGPSTTMWSRPGPPELWLAYQVAPGTPTATLRVLIELLGHPGAGMLAMVESNSNQPVVADVWPRQGQGIGREGGLLFLGMEIPDVRRHCSLVERIRYGLAGIALDGPPPAALEAARKRVSAQVQSELGPSGHLAEALAWSELTTGYSGETLTLLSEIGRVQGEDLKKVASELFAPSRQSVLVAADMASVSLDCE